MGLGLGLGMGLGLGKAIAIKGDAERAASRPEIDLATLADQTDLTTVFTP